MAIRQSRRRLRLAPAVHTGKENLHDLAERDVCVVLSACVRAIVNVRAFARLNLDSDITIEGMSMSIPSEFNVRVPQ